MEKKTFKNVAVDTTVAYYYIQGAPGGTLKRSDWDMEVTFTPKFVPGYFYVAGSLAPPALFWKKTDPGIGYVRVTWGDAGLFDAQPAADPDADWGDDERPF